MYKPPKNPKIEEFTKSCKDRVFNLSNIPSIKVEKLKFCVWCTDPLHGAQRRWCGDENCVNSAKAWGCPQREEGLHVILARQDFKCAGCQYDYLPYVQSALSHLNKYHPTVDPTKIKEKISYILMKVLKNKVPRTHAPEVDHVIPIFKGGTPVGLDNVHCLCFTCHKAKTRVDNSGPRKKVK